jgi:hypothetical protein
MFPFALSSARKLLLAGTAAALLSLASIPIHAQPDPPAQAGRLSYITGNVSFQTQGSDDWGQAIPNLPLGPGDRIVTDFDGRAEIQVGQTFVRIGPNADISLIDSTPMGLYFGVAQGPVHIQVRGLWDGQSVYVNTPSGSATESTPGQFRVDVFPDQDAALFTAFGVGNNLLITGAGGFAQNLPGQALELVGSNPVVPQWMAASDWDILDQWSQQRDQQIAQARSYQYVSPEVPGAYELDAAGTWQPGTPYGAIWFPNNVPGGWAPYHYGHWVNHAPWGWVWIEDESWGYAPFHYGRWVAFNGRWGWIPGPPAAHPVWSPALVVFAGGVHVGGASVSAWFPLGPGEPYRPWYPCSPRYIDRVNISNITVTNVVHVQTTYVNINVVNVTYVNRTTAVTAMRQEDFASGRPAHQAAVVIDIHQLDHMQVLAKPEPRPTAQSFVGHPPVRAVKVSVARPVLINEKGMAVTASPGARPAPPPVKPAPPVRALPGHTAIAPPPGAKPPTGVKTPPAPAASAPNKPVPAKQPAAPAAAPAPKPVVKPTPAPETKAPPTPAAKTPADRNDRPAAAPAARPGGPPATPPNAAKPGTPPLARPPAQPNGKPPSPPAAKPGAPPVAPPNAVRPGTTPPAKPPTEPNGKPPAPPAAKPGGPPAAPPNAVKPGTTPPAKTDKNRKDDKEKDKDREDKKPE